MLPPGWFAASLVVPAEGVMPDERRYSLHIAGETFELRALRYWVHLNGSYQEVYDARRVRHYGAVVVRGATVELESHVNLRDYHNPRRDVKKLTTASLENGSIVVEFDDEDHALATGRVVLKPVETDLWKPEPWWEKAS